MRTSTVIRLLCTVLFFSVLQLSCKKNDQSLSESSKPEEPNDYKFLCTKLKDFAVSFAPALASKETRNIIINKARQKFDGEYEVLIKDLFEDTDITSLVPAAESKKLHDALFARSGEHLYPQIYIPRLQYLEDYPEAKGNLIGKTGENNLVEEPVYVFYSGDAEVDSAATSEIWPGYKLVGGVYQFFVMVDEAYANEHEVWVFSLNESVNQAGRYPVPCDIDPCAPGCPNAGSPECGGGGTGGGGTTGGPDDDPTDAPAARVDFPDLGHSKTNFKMTSMVVYQHKETWVAGASEVCIRAKLVCHNGRELGGAGAAKKEYTSDQYSNYLGKLIKKVKRKDIKDSALIMLDYPLQTNWQNQVIDQDPIHFFYVIFERDKWPASKNKNFRDVGTSMETLQSSPGSFPLFYRSGGSGAGYDFPYHQYFFSNNRRSWWANGYPLDAQILTPGPRTIDFTTVSY